MTQYVTVKKTKGIEYVYITDVSYDIDKEGKKKRVYKLVQSLGKLTSLLEDDPQALEKLKEKYKGPSVKYRENRASSIKDFLGTLKDLPSSDDNQNILKGFSSVRMNYGIWALKPIWNDWLTLDATIDYLTQENTDIKFDTNAIISYLTYIKILDPSSHYKAFKDQTKFLNNPLEGIQLHDIYRALDFLFEQKDHILSHVHRRVTDIVGRNISMVFYDCTNMFFETAYDDKQQLTRKIIKQIKEERQSAGASEKDIEEYLNSDEFRDKFIERFEAVASSKEVLFRMRGLSKEHRYDLPLVSIALVIDDKGIPIDFEALSGNTSEYKTMPIAVERLIKKYGIKNATVVADRGLNSVANLAMLLEKDYGFIVAQKVSQLSEDVEKEMLDLESYSKFYFKDINSRGDLDEEKDENKRSYMLYKKIPYTKSGHIVDEETGKKQKKLIDCEIVFTFSQKRKKRDIAQLEADIVKAEEAIKNQKDMAPVFSSGWKSLIYVKADDANRNKNESIYKAHSLKKDVIEKRRRLAGFAAVVYKATAKAEGGVADEEILNSYSKLVRIEECFRIMKSNFSIRPIYLSNHNRIVAHITICVLALIMLRLLQIKLDENNCSMSLNEISSTLLNAEVAAMSNDGIDGFFNVLEDVRDVYTIENLQKDENDEDVDAVEKYIKTFKEKGRAIDRILKVVNLQPLNSVLSSNDLARCLKLKRGYMNLVGDAISRIQKSINQA